MERKVPSVGDRTANQTGCEDGADKESRVEGRNSDAGEAESACGKYVDIERDDGCANYGDGRDPDDGRYE